MPRIWNRPLVISSSSRVSARTVGPARDLHQHLGPVRPGIQWERGGQAWSRQPGASLAGNDSQEASATSSAATSAAGASLSVGGEGAAIAPPGPASIASRCPSRLKKPSWRTLLMKNVGVRLTPLRTPPRTSHVGPSGAGDPCMSCREGCKPPRSSGGLRSWHAAAAGGGWGPSRRPVTARPGGPGAPRRRRAPCG